MNIPLLPRQCISIKFVLCVVGLSMATACKTPQREATDEDILALLGNSEKSPHANAIRPEVYSCLWLISSFEQHKPKDIPPEFSTFRRNCESRLLKLVEDPDRNPLGIQLENMKKPDFLLKVDRIRNNMQGSPGNT